MYARRSVADTAGVAELYVVPHLLARARAARARGPLGMCLAFRGGRRLIRVASISMNTSIHGC